MLIVERNSDYSSDVRIYYDKEGRYDNYRALSEDLGDKKGYRLSWDDRDKYSGLLCTLNNDGFTKNCQIFLKISQDLHHDRFYRIILHRYTKQMIKPMFEARLDETSWAQVSMQDQYIQRISLKNMGTHNYEAGLESVIKIAIFKGSQLVDVSFKTCRANLSCDVPSYE